MEKYKILLELALHRYDEINRRNEIIDDKNKSMIAFIGVMLTIEFSAIPNIIKTLNETTPNGGRTLLFLGISSICCYFISIFYFISAVNPIKKFKEAPAMDELVSSEKNDELDKIVAKNIISLKKCVEKNYDTVECKAKKSKNGFDFLKYGVLLTVMFIILFILLKWRW